MKTLEVLIQEYQQSHGTLPGLQGGLREEAFLQHIRASATREAQIRALKGADLGRPEDLCRADPFGPYEAAAALATAGEVEEAIWLCFMAAMVGHHEADGWRRLKVIYQQFDGRTLWSWANVSADPLGFRTWLLDNLERLLGADGVKRRRGNHRKFCSPDPRKRNNFADTVEAYVSLIAKWTSQRGWVAAVYRSSGGDPELAFDLMFKTLDPVKNFGRLGCFDFLTRLGHLGLARVEPRSPFLVGATGPAQGANRLFTGNSAQPTRREARQLDYLAGRLAKHLGVTMSVIEDALCCWNKAPDIVVL